MCGIAGMITPRSHRGGPVNAPVMVAMVAAMRHRGPDDQGIWSAVVGDYELGLGHSRLAILDLSDTARQPMVDPASGCVLVYNGEIYNFAALRDELLRAGDAPLDSSGDTQVLLRAYIRWGSDCVRKLRGMFAFAIYDPRRRRLFLARDQFGIKPLYLAEGDGGEFAFASEVRTLLKAPWVPRALDPLGLMSYLAYGSVQDPYTLVAGIRSVPPGHCLTLDLSQDRLSVGELAGFHDIAEINPAPREMPAGEAVQQTREALMESVRLHLASDVPLGVFLSGGMDSASLVALMAEVAPSRVHTLNIAFAEADFDESEIAREVARRFATEHTEIRLTAAHFLADLPRWLGSLDQPSADGANVWMVSKASREAGLTVALSGLGGDELFGGYQTFPRTLKASRLFKKIAWLPKRARSWMGGLIRSLGHHSIPSEKLAEWLGGNGSKLSTYLTLRRMFLPRLCQDLVIPPVAVCGGRFGLHPEVWDRLVRAAAAPDPYTAVSLFEMHTYLVNTLLRDSDQMGMAHSLEIRVPFVDRKLTALVLSLQSRTDFKGQGPKPLLRAAMADLLEPAWIERPKMTFTLPFDYWLRGPLKSEVEHSLKRLAGLPFKPGAVSEVWQRFLQDRKQVSSSQIIMLYVLAKWLDEHHIEYQA